MRGEKSKLLKMYLHEQMKPGDDSIWRHYPSYAFTYFHRASGMRRYIKCSEEQ